MKIKQNKEKEALLSISELRRILWYDPDSGLFVRRVSLGNSKSGSVAGSAHNNGYIQIQINKYTYLAHRLAYFYVNGVWPQKEIDHINGCRHDNRLVNLRDATCLENSMNKSVSISCTSGSTGVSWNKRLGKWSSYISESGKRKHLGVFVEYKDARRARADAAQNIGYHENHGKQRIIR